MFCWSVVRFTTLLQIGKNHTKKTSVLCILRKFGWSGGTIFSYWPGWVNKTCDPVAVLWLQAGGGGSPCICLTLQILSSLACLYTTVINCLMICCCVQCRLTVYPVKTCCGVCWSWTRARDLTSERLTLRILCTRLSVETFWSLDSWWRIIQRRSAVCNSGRTHRFNRHLPGELGACSTAHWSNRPDHWDNLC